MIDDYVKEDSSVIRIQSSELEQVYLTYNNYLLITTYC